ncbi:MAG: amino acid adenylation domain-containing protein, partial [Candidatus Aminicenantes bacterium]
PDHVALVGQITNYKLQITNKAEPFGQVLYAFGAWHLSYKELNEKANQLALLLKEKGVKCDTIVGIMMERSIEMITAILGILKAGGAYLPIDPDYPQERINYMLNDSQAKILLTTKNIAKAIEFDKEVIHLYSPWPSASLNLSEGRHPDFPTSQLPSFPASLPSSLAYVIYTSGSTGKPKGVMIRHRSLVNYVYWAAKKYVKNEKTNFPLFTSISFDLTVTSIFTPLITGNTIVIYAGSPEEGNLIEKIIDDNQVGVIKLTPSHLYMIKDKPTAGKASIIKCFIVGGEKLDSRIAKEIHNNFNGEILIYNEYGPTEATIGCMIYQFDPRADNTLSVPIGKPASNYQIYVLDKNLHPVPRGVVGELYISGVGLARGYLNRPELTAEKFIKGTRGLAPLLYRTGDLAHWLEDGNIEFLGRTDHQVKIRGYRIELAEIENHLLNHEDIQAAVVVVKGMDEGLPGSAIHSDLCAYITAGEKLSVPGIRDYLSKHLPEYMIPSHFVQLDRIPLTSSGKINRSALPAPQFKPGQDYAPPRNPKEQKLAALWSEVLAPGGRPTGTDQVLIGIDDNFFELGGHSLKAIFLAAKIHKEINIKIPLIEIFKTPTIRGLSAYIKGASEDRYASIQPMEKRQYYDLSSAQKRLYILQQMEPDNVVYNMPQLVPLSGETDTQKLERVFKKLIARHESLRTSFHMIKDKPVQEIHEDFDFEVEYLDFKIARVEVKVKDGDEEGTRGLAPLPIEPAATLISSFIRPFDLARAPLLRLGLLKRGDNKNLLMIDMHHIISDGTSQAVLKDEFGLLVQGQVLAPLRLQYKDYSQWQDRENQQRLLKKQEAYWIKELSGELPVLRLPTDYPRPLVQDFAGSSVNFLLNTAETQTLKKLTGKANASLFMTILAVFNVLLSKLSGQEDVIVGTPIVGRRHADLERIIGMFVNTLALRNFPCGEKKFMEFLWEVKARTLDTFENQEYQFEDLVENVPVPRDVGHNPIFDVMLNLLNQEDHTNVMPKIDENPSSLYKHRKGISKFDMTWNVQDLGENLLFSLEYCTKLFKANTIERIIVYFRNILHLLAENSNQKISAVEIITRAEKQRILLEFNHTQSEYPEHQTIHELFEEQVEQTPDHVALVGQITNYKLQITNKAEPFG